MQVESAIKLKKDSAFEDLPRGFDIIEVRDSQGKGVFCAVAPNCIPLVFWQGRWELSSPTIASLIAMCAAHQTHVTVK